MKYVFDTDAELEYELAADYYEIKQLLFCKFGFSN
jgi:hypothetical protein